MTVRELIEELSKVNPEAIVVKSSDEEGNSFSVVDQIDTNAAIHNPNDYDVEIGLKHLTDELVDKGYCEDDLAEGPEAVVLW